MGPERYPMTRGSRPEAFEPPRVVRPGVAEPVMQAMFPSLPELERHGLEAVPAPVRRQRDVVPGVPRVELGERGFELLARGDRTALLGRPRADPRLARSAREVRGRPLP